MYLCEMIHVVAVCRGKMQSEQSMCSLIDNVHDRRCWFLAGGTRDLRLKLQLSNNEERSTVSIRQGLFHPSVQTFKSHFAPDQISHSLPLPGMLGSMSKTHLWRPAFLELMSGILRLLDKKSLSPP
jgi:hypothetical protein